MFSLSMLGLYFHPLNIFKGAEDFNLGKVQYSEKNYELCFWCDT